jgi:hypothetical protein
MADLPHNLPAMDGGTTPSFQMVKVTNNNTFVLLDRFDGVPFQFLPGKPLSIPPDAAAHFFGWPGEPDLMRLYIAKRHGWNTPDDIKRADDGRMRWEMWVDKIEISAVHFDLVQRDPSAQIPADPGIDDPELETMAESNDLPMPISPDADTSTTKVGRRNPNASRKPPRRVDL